MHIPQSHTKFSVICCTSLNVRCLCFLLSVQIVQQTGFQVKPALLSLTCWICLHLICRSLFPCVCMHTQRASSVYLSTLFFSLGLWNKPGKGSGELRWLNNVLTTLVYMPNGHKGLPLDQRSSKLQQRSAICISCEMVSTLCAQTWVPY